jgi:hypothetical protein
MQGLSLHEKGMEEGQRKYGKVPFDHELKSPAHRF